MMIRGGVPAVAADPALDDRAHERAQQRCAHADDADDGAVALSEPTVDERRVAMYIQNAADAPYSTPYTFHCHGSVNQAQASEAKPKTAAAAVITQRGLNLEMSLPANGVQIAATTAGWTCTASRRCATSRTLP